MNTTHVPADALFLGLDLSTQGLKTTLIDGRLDVVGESAVGFDADLPEFGTRGGAHRHADGLTVTSPPLMWVAALDRALEPLRSAGHPLSRVAAVSGSGQQHGSVWLRPGADAALAGLKPDATLRDQLAGLFALDASPIWMDSSTGRQCAEREAALGGPQAVAELTGSRAYERFTGNQIAKLYQSRPEVYEATERICLVSSFMASLLAGRVAPIDASDGSGMNLMDIRARAWAPAALACTAPGLGPRLGPIVASHAAVGLLHPYFSARFGLPADGVVIAFSGDNPNSLAGLRLERPGDVAVSLGTSDTVFGSLAEPKPSSAEGHIFVNPISPSDYMALLCRMNGSLTREYVRDEFAGGSWEAFTASLRETPAGNGGRIAFHIRTPEITPPILKTGVFRFDAGGRPVDRFPAGADARAVVEGQFLSMRLHGANVGLRPGKILATGGASANAAILQVMADVFGVPVWVGEQPNSASLGAAYRALHGWLCARAGRLVPFGEAVRGASPFRIAAEPDPAAHRVYEGALARYRELEDRVARGG